MFEMENTTNQEVIQSFFFSNRKGPEAELSDIFESVFIYETYFCPKRATVCYVHVIPLLLLIATIFQSSIKL